MVFDELTFLFAKTPSTTNESHATSKVNLPDQSFTLVVVPTLHDFSKTTVSNIPSPILSTHDQFDDIDVNIDVVNEPLTGPINAYSSALNDLVDIPATIPNDSSIAAHYMVLSTSTSVKGKKHQIVTHSKNRVFKPKVFVANREPSTVKEAFHVEHWKSAMTEESMALQRNQTWSLCLYHWKDTHWLQMGF